MLTQIYKKNMIYTVIELGSYDYLKDNFTMSTSQEKKCSRIKLNGLAATEERYKDRFNRVVL
jgi:preprotein translocase subunit SecA